MTTYKSTQHTAHKKIVVKLGGSMLARLTDTFFEELKNLKASGAEIVIVHGGGPAINKALKERKINSYTHNGIRVTSAEAIETVTGTLIGTVNPFLTGRLNRAGIPAVGLNGEDGNLIECTYLDQETYGYVGNIESINIDLLEQLQKIDYIPVVACIGATVDGTALNINGDTVASEIALEWGADELLLVTDTPGVKFHEETVEELTPEQIDLWIVSGDIYGGMIPKVKAAVECLEAGIPQVKIVDDALEGTSILRKKVLV
jgi:acetylglutamate kinase